MSHQPPPRIGPRGLEVTGQAPVERVDVEQVRFLVDAAELARFLALEGGGWLLEAASAGTFADARGAQRRALEVVFTRAKGGTV